MQTILMDKHRRKLHWPFLYGLEHIYVSGRRRKMNTKIREIYEDQIRNMKEDEIERELKEGVIDILKNSMIENEKFDIAFKIAEVGEEAGFVRGFRYAVQLMMECR